MRVQLLGKGAWGQALAELLRRNGHEVTLHDQNDEARWESPDFVLLVVPSKFLAGELRRWSSPGVPVVSAVKGIETGSLRRVSQIVEEVWGSVDFAVLSGPSFAVEVAAGQPAAVTVASADAELAQKVQGWFHRPEFRVYRSGDLVGVELGGSLKNVYAIAAGACAGLALGHNALAALVTRALAEMARLGVALGGQLDTFMGLSGAGDLMLTCYGEQSRNRSLGSLLAHDTAAGVAQGQLHGVAEGATTAFAARHLAKQSGVSAPLIEAVCRMIEGEAGPQELLQGLLSRPPTEEIQRR